MDGKRWSMVLGVASLIVIVAAFPLFPHWTAWLVFGLGVGLAAAGVIYRVLSWRA